MLSGVLLIANAAGKPIDIYTSHLVMLPCHLVWQEAEVAMLGTSRNLHDLRIFTCARRLKRRAQVSSSSEKPKTSTGQASGILFKSTRVRLNLGVRTNRRPG